MAATTIGPMLQALLNKYGLGSLASWMSGKIISGASEDEIMLELYDRPEFKAAFPEIEARRKKAQESGIALTPLSADDVLNARTQYSALMRSFGLPPAFYNNNQDFFNLIVNDVSPDELKGRLNDVQSKVILAPPEVRTAFQSLYGDASDSALYMLAVDPDKAAPELERMLNTAGTMGAGSRFGFNLNESQSSRLANYGIDYSQAVQGFSSLAEESGLLDETLYEDVDLNLDTGIEATFGLNAESAKKLERRAGERTASTSGNAGGLIEQRGATGLGGAGRL